MNESKTTYTNAQIGSLLARHSLATIVTVAVPCVLWTITYFALLLWALASGGGIGSPVSYPLTLFFIVIGATAVAITLFFPSTALAEWFARRRGLPVLAQIPISVAVSAAICFAVASVASAAGAESSFREVPINFAILFLAHLLPLGLYWWVAQGGPLILALAQRLFRIRHS